jgi:adenylate cyclase
LQPSRIKEINSLAGAIAIARDAIRTFALYVPRELVRKIIASSQRLAGAAIRQEVTVLFTDIRDFTTICEQHRPEHVVAMLSAYFELMNEGVERHHGSIIQFLGDSIYAMWNAPVNDPRQAVHACRCALELAALVKNFNTRQREAGKPEFVTRFGLHIGQAVVGSVGALNRLQYTAMGDTVNVASRLEGINKEFGTTIIVSRAVRDRSSDEFEFRALGLCHAKGRSEKVEIFELVAAR